MQPQQLPLSYQQIISELSEAVMVVTPDLQVVCVNNPVLKLLRCDAEDIVGYTLRETFPELQIYFSTNRAYHMADSPLLLSGRYVEVTVKPLGEDDALHGYLLILTDTSASVMAEQALISYQQRYRALFDNSNDAIVICDLDLSILTVNAHSETLLQHHQAVILRNTILNYIHPDEHTEFRVMTSHLLNNRPVPLHELHLINANHRVVPTEISMTLVRDSEKKPLHIQLIIRDISERRRSEKNLQWRFNQMNLLNQATQVINQSLDIRHVLDVSLNAANTLANADGGFISLLQEDDITIRQVVGVFDEGLIGNRIDYQVGITGRVLSEQEPEWVVDVHQDPDYFSDNPETQSLMAMPLISQERLLGILTLETSNPNNFNEDVFQLMKLFCNQVATAIENAQLYAFVRRQLQEVNRVYEELRSAEDLKTDLIRIANHDLKNPVAVVKGFIELMELDLDRLPEEYETYLAQMKNSLDRADDILEEFLSVDALNERLKGMRVTKFQLNSLVEQAIEEFTPQLQKSQHQLSVHVPDEQYMVEGDSAQIYEAMNNLISNAIKYTPENGRIQISLSQQGDDSVQFLVEDNGFGIPENRQKRLFEPFYRSATSETSNIDGTGLGLNLVKNIVERHDGDIVFQSEYHKGSQFGFVLPLAGDI